MRELEEAIGDYLRLHRRSFDPLLPPAAGPRALLKAQLHQLASPPANRSWDWIGRATWRSALVAISVIAIAVCSAFILRQEWSARRERHAYRPAMQVTIPNAVLTPGVAAAYSRDEVCNDNLPKNKTVSVSVRRRVLGAYGIRSLDPEAYEVDYLITPALGGSDDIRNLWPQPYSSTAWNARVKDALEDRLHQLVCSGDLDLATAQRDISRDWIAAYKHYFRTDRPIAELAH